MFYIKGVADDLSYNAKLFPDDTSLFSVVNDVDTSANELNNDWYQINKWAFQWKMRFNQDPSKEAQEMIFSRKTKKTYHPLLRLITALSRKPYIKNIYLHNSWCSIFSDAHLEVITAKVNKTIGLLLKFQKKITKTFITKLSQDHF